MMSSSEDERLSQMIKDYIELGSAKTESCLFHFPFETLQSDNNPTYYFSLQEILEDTTEAETEVYGKILFYLKDIKEAKENINKLKKWIVFRLKMDNYEAHLCKTSWSTPLIGCPSVFQFAGDYEYVEVMINDKNGGKQVRLIVDLDFRTQFELARPTPNYTELTNAIPFIFVGNEEKLEKLISLICSAAKQSLTERGLHIPPWRKASYMKSKWLSKNYKRVSFSEFSSVSTTYIPNNGRNSCFYDFLQSQQLGTYNC